jgi:ribosomal protein S18 acetylase RimI-like enzyme
VSEVSLRTVEAAEQEEFLNLAAAYFRELNPFFVPKEDWRASYFAQLRTDPNLHVEWIQTGAERTGFVIYGTEKHRFLPRQNGCVYEFYIVPRLRGGGMGREAARKIIAKLRELAPTKIQLEVASGNPRAAEFWQGLGFRKVSERYVLEEGSK